MSEHDSTQAAPVRHTHIGGQAVLEGVMMRGKLNWAVAVRRPDGTIHCEEHDLVTAASEHQWLKLPIIRGIWGFYETMVLALKAFNVSASQIGETEEEQLSSGEVGFTMVLGLVLAVALFIVLPAFATNALLGSSLKHPFVWNLVDGVLRLIIFFAYIFAISRINDIQRVFAYHGAEHKTIHAYEHALPLDPEHIQRFDTLHVRCGTSFLLMVMIVAIVVFSLVPGKAILAAWGVHSKVLIVLFNIGVRIVLLPLVAGIAYEVTVKWAGPRADKPFVRAVLWPGLQLQRMTTRPPDDSMVEVAVTAMEAVVRRELDSQPETQAVLADAEGAPEPLSSAALEGE